MADNPTFNINFVKVVEKYPCIWNYSLPEYSKRNLTEKAWAKVANEVKDTVSNCRERWRNIRGVFQRSLKKPPSGSGANVKKKYYLDEFLHFLLPYLKNKAGDSNLQSVIDSLSLEESEDENTDSMEHTEHPMESQVAQENRGSTISSFANSPSEMDNEGPLQDLADKSVIVAKKTFKKRKHSENPSSTINPADEAFINWIKYKQDKESNSSSNTNEHPNMLFLRSLFPDLMKMTDKQNRRFRHKVLGLIDDIIEDKDISPSNANTSLSRSEWSIEEENNGGHSQSFLTNKNSRQKFF